MESGRVFKDMKKPAFQDLGCIWAGIDERSQPSLGIEAGSCTK